VLQHRKRRSEPANHGALDPERVEHGQCGSLLCAFGALDDRRDDVHELGCRNAPKVGVDDPPQHVLELRGEARADRTPYLIAGDDHQVLERSALVGPEQLLGGPADV
jgi:hypothetical protein